MTWTLTLQRLPLSGNKYARTHWANRARELREITNELGWLANAERIPAATGKRWVRITLHKSMRSRVTDDPANRDSRAKNILDACVKLGLLVDDSDQWLEWAGVIEGERMAQVCTVVTISETTRAAA